MSPSTYYIISAVILVFAVLTSVESAISDFGFGSNGYEFGNGNGLSRAELQKWGNLKAKRSMMGYDDDFGIWSPSRNKFINWQAVLGGASKRDFENVPKQFGSTGRLTGAGLQNWRHAFIKRQAKRSSGDNLEN